MAETDLTIIFLTLNKTPEKFAKFQQEVLIDAAGAYPIVSISRIPMTLGKNLIDTEEPSYINIYRQMLRGAKEATTPYVAVAEDDVLYTSEHFNFYRPPLDTFAYNQNRFALFTWGEPMFSWRNRKSNCSLIAPRELLIEALEERFEKHGDNWPEGFVGELGRGRIEKALGVTQRKSVEVFSEISIVQFNHTSGTEKVQRSRKKAHGPIKAYSIPVWGMAHFLKNKYK